MYLGVIIIRVSRVAILGDNVSLTASSADVWEIQTGARSEREPLSNKTSAQRNPSPKYTDRKKSPGNAWRQVFEKIYVDFLNV